MVGVLEDKDAAGMLETLLPHVDRVVFTALEPALALAGDSGHAVRELGGPPAETVAHPPAALERARELAGPEGAVLATGSIYLIADLVREDAGARASTL